jgi:hypothetical protein
MYEFTLDTLAQRMNQLEREVRRWRLGATILLLCAVAVFVMGQTFPKAQVIEAQRFILRGGDGKVHAILGRHALYDDAPSAEKYDPERGSWGLHIFGSDGKHRAGLLSFDALGIGGYLKLFDFDKDTKSEASLAAGSGYADLLLEAWERQSKEPDISARLLLLGRDRTALTLSEKEGSEVVLGHIELAKPQEVVEKRPLSSLVFFDKDRKVIWKAP